MPQQRQQRFRRVWGYIRLGLLALLVVMLVYALASRDWGTIAPTAVFIALLAFLEAMDRGWIQRFGGGGPPQSR